MSYCKLNKCACTCIDLLSVLEVCTRIARKSHTYSCIPIDIVYAAARHDASDTFQYVHNAAFVFGACRRQG